MKLIALNNYVVVKYDKPAESMRESGIVVSETKTIQATGVITSIGPTIREDLQEGDLVLVPPLGVGDLIRDETDQYLVLLDFEVYGRLPRPPYIELALIDVK